MEYTHLGSAGLKISRVAMGTMSFGEGDSGREGRPIPYEDAVPFFRQAVDLGREGDSWTLGSLAFTRLLTP